MSADPLLRVQDLCLYFRTNRGVVRAVDGVSFGLDQGQALAVLGESGCGKSSLARAMLRLLPRNVHSYSGRVFLNDSEVMSLDEERFRREVRWSGISLVAQAAMNSLNPVVKVGDQVTEPLTIQRRWNRARARERAAEVLGLVGLPVGFLDRYPFELSGGMRQRAVIAMALVAGPPLVILDEPTSALDMLTQAGIMNVLKGIKGSLDSSFLLITHDIATASELADRVAVMYAGQLVEVSEAAEFFSGPLHPYSRGLMTSVPRLRSGNKPEFIPGQPPSLIDPDGACRFAPRCPLRFQRCQEEPPMVEVEPGRWVRCWLYTGGSGAVSHET